MMSQSAPWALAAVHGLEFHSGRQWLGKNEERRGGDQNSGVASDHGAESAKTFPVHTRGHVAVLEGLLRCGRRTRD